MCVAGGKTSNDGLVHGLWVRCEGTVLATLVVAVVTVVAVVMPDPGSGHT